MKIGQALIDKGLLSPEQLKILLEEQKKTNDRLGDLAIKMGFISSEMMAPFLAEYFSLPFVKLREIYKTVSPETIEVIPEVLARRFTLLPVSLDDKILTIAMFDPLDVVAEDTIKIKTGFKIKKQWRSRQI